MAYRGSRLSKALGLVFDSDDCRVGSVAVPYIDYHLGVETPTVLETECMVLTCMCRPNRRQVNFTEGLVAESEVTYMPCNIVHEA